MSATSAMSAMSAHLRSRTFPLDLTPADIVPVKAFRPANMRDCLIGARLRLAYSFPCRGYIEDATAIGENVARFDLGAGVEDFDAFYRGRRIEAFNHRAARIIS